MTVIRPGPAALAVLIAALVPMGAAADHGPDPLQPAAYNVMIPVDAMPPVTRAAYLAGISEELAAHGYDRGPLDAAIRAYQHDAGLPVDGVASKGLLDHLKFVLPKVYAARAPAGGPTPYHEAPRYETPRYETPRSAVPLAPAPGTGRKFWPDEVISEPLPDLPPAPSEEAIAPLPGTPDVPPLAPPEASPRRAPPAETEQAETEHSPTIGGVVSQVQTALKRRGYYPGPVTGKFDPGTSAAVRRFQEDQGLPVDGVINTTLLNALEAPPRSEAPAAPDGGSGTTGNL